MYSPKILEKIMGIYPRQEFAMWPLEKARTRSNTLHYHNILRLKSEREKDTTTSEVPTSLSFVFSSTAGIASLDNSGNVRGTVSYP